VSQFSVDKCLHALAAAGKTLPIRRGPRDLSRIFVLDAENNAYLEIPCRMLSRPAITPWEHKLARKRLREQRRTAIDEMREIERIPGGFPMTAAGRLRNRFASA
jgi:hypothetical protein